MTDSELVFLISWLHQSGLHQGFSAQFFRASDLNHCSQRSDCSVVSSK